MNGFMQALAGVAFVLLFWAVLPVSIVWGWIRQKRSGKPSSIYAWFSLSGFGLATAAALLVIASIIWSSAIGGFKFYDPRLLAIYRWGVLLAGAGFLVSIVGTVRKSILRWQAPVASLGMVIFWVLMAAGE